MRFPRIHRVYRGTCDRFSGAGTRACYVRVSSVRFNATQRASIVWLAASERVPLVYEVLPFGLVSHGEHFFCSPRRYNHLPAKRSLHLYIARPLFASIPNAREAAGIAADRIYSSASRASRELSVSSYVTRRPVLSRKKPRRRLQARNHPCGSLLVSICLLYTSPSPRD